MFDLLIQIDAAQTFLVSTGVLSGKSSYIEFTLFRVWTDKVLKEYLLKGISDKTWKLNGSRFKLALIGCVGVWALNIYS